MAKKESTTKSFVLRLDADTMEAVEKWAADEFRSTNGQLQWIITEALRKSGRLKKRKRSVQQEENTASGTAEI
ncbi:Arc family DNA-binding protein [Bacteroides gallinaceum]|uniref:Arc family DNA-binding protein n=1 Tax=Bacteroidaceae TaxID=815 RepID=UPI000B37A66C|nr:MULTISPECIES: Arc family DNA-binding protein [Bacteroides]HJD10609.1 Arc family DNA-binding protein [Candidatus Phocaeicola caecigallinarum]MBM6944547.1 Arc family DNA-binding protein [Bacteroides gallinaceum]MDN0067342.1 Arc family DNA-binding protein [Bacteroides gallinaceum]MDN0079056.1 Arc family DNA-binding protein [Bacteroides gallinaceum]OUO58432.1 DNA-binding protein [Bacteroides sp. An279]